MSRKCEKCDSWVRELEHASGYTVTLCDCKRGCCCIIAQLQGWELNYHRDENGNLVHENYCGMVLS